MGWLEQHIIFQIGQIIQEASLRELIYTTGSLAMVQEMSRLRMKLDKILMHP